MKEEPNLVSHNLNFFTSMVESLFIDLCDFSYKGNPSFLDVVVPDCMNSWLVEKQPLHLDVPQVGSFHQHCNFVESNVSSPTCLFWIEVLWLQCHHNWVCDFSSHKIQWWHIIWASPYVSYIGDILENCKVWIKSMMVMFGASCRPLTSRNRLDWALKWWNDLGICVIRIIIVFYFNIILCTMKLEWQLFPTTNI
jgi:hypothetical protein